MFEALQLAVEHGDFAPATDLVLECYPFVDTRELDDRSVSVARTFVLMCSRLLTHEPYLDYERANQVDESLRDVATRADRILLSADHSHIRRVAELRARHDSRMSIARGGRAVVDGLPLGDVREARRSPGRWRYRPENRLLRQGSLAAGRALIRRRGDARRHRAWRRAVHRPGEIAERARRAVAWAEWALGTGVGEFAAEAYGYLVALSAQDAAARQGVRAREQVLTAAQEYAEEAGYWLARTRRYREAAIALETGRSIGLTGDLGTEALAYEDIAQQTGDGALVYLAAARAGGYALVIAATHDPQYVDLPQLDRATVEGITVRVLGAAAASAPHGRDLETHDPPVSEPMTAALSELWDRGLRDVVLVHARGRVVTLIPVGLFNLLPVHAAGDPGGPLDAETHWRHVGHFSAVRYAPNARALRHCRERAAEFDGRVPTLLAVDAPAGPGGEGHLRFARLETEEITRRWDEAARPIHSCTWEEFRSAAGRHTVWHIACHGTADPRSILDSALSFADRKVTLAELSTALTPASRRLAVLSACRTNVVGATLPNEAQGLPSALLRLGFAGVIATGWAVDDLAATYLMTAFYHYWRRAGDQPAVALNHAQQWLRRASRAELAALLPHVEPPDRPYADPRYWAAFAYTGA
jgi:hypothetical protein